MKHSRHARVGIAPLLALSLVAAGCARGPEPRPDQKAIPVDAVDINEMPRDKVKDGGTLTLTITEAISNFNPEHADGRTGDTFSVVLSMLPGPFDTDAKANFHVDKRYFESAEITATEPKQVITYRINPKAHWDDGTPITWKDMESQFNALSGKNQAFQLAGTQGYERMESVVRGGDDREAIVTYAHPYSDWQGPFSPLLPASTTSDPKVFNEGWKDRPLLTAGSFKFESLDKTTQTITLVRNEKWWGDKAKLDKIVFRVVSPNAEMDSLANREIDTADIGPNANAYKRAQRMKGVAIRKAAGPDYRHVTVNAQSEIMSDLKVRRAFGLALNRDAIATALLTAVGVPARPQNNHIYMANQPGYKDNAGEFAKQDLAKARRLLEEAGWKLNGDVREKNGKKLKLRLVIPANVTQATQEALLVQQQVKAAGFQVDIQATKDFFVKYVNPGDFDITIFTWGGGTFPISSAKSIYVKPTKNEKGDDVIQQNYARVGSDELDALFDEATEIFDADEAKRVGNQIDKMIWEEVHSFPFYQRPDIVAVRSDLANIGASGFQSTPHIEDVGFVEDAA